MLEMLAKLEQERVPGASAPDLSTRASAAIAHLERAALVRFSPEVDAQGHEPVFAEIVVPRVVVVCGGLQAVDAAVEVTDRPAACDRLDDVEHPLVVQEQQQPGERRVDLHARLDPDSRVLPSVEVRARDPLCDLVSQGSVEEAGNEEAMSVPELVPKASELVAGRDAELLGR